MLLAGVTVLVDDLSLAGLEIWDTDRWPFYVEGTSRILLKNYLLIPVFECVQVSTLAEVPHKYVFDLPIMQRVPQIAESAMPQATYNAVRSTDHSSHFGVLPR